VDVARECPAVSRHTTTAESRGMSGNCSAARAKGANAPHCRQVCVLKHRGGTLKVRNDRFTVNLSGARPRRWESEFLSIFDGSFGALRSAWIRALHSVVQKLTLPRSNCAMPNPPDLLSGITVEWRTRRCAHCWPVGSTYLSKVWVDTTLVHC
jgi:hypothetical protein